MQSRKEKQMLRRPKISIIGAGNVGSTCAHWAAAQELGDIVLLDIPDRVGVARGKSLDLQCTAPIAGFDLRIQGTDDFGDTASSDVVIITAGVPRKPGMDRGDLISTNVEIVKEVTDKVARYSPNCMLIVVSNPLDAMTYVAWKVSGFPHRRVMGQAGCLDVARYKTFVAMEIGCSVEDVEAILLGGHGDDMVPLPRLTSVHGIPATKLLSEEKLQRCVDRAKYGGGEVVKLMGTSAYFAPAAATVQMAEALIRDKKRILPAAGFCAGEYGINGYFVGVPCLLGSEGVERIIEIDLNDDEQALLDSSVEYVRDLVNTVQEMFPEFK
jgi:malate dehydrogenase